MTQSIGEMESSIKKLPSEVVLHLGAHKTATTHLQKTLVKNESVLAANNVKFYGPESLRERGHRLRERFSIKSKFEAKNIFSSNTYRHALRTTNKNGRTSIEEVSFMANGANRLVLSNENLINPRKLDTQNAKGKFYPRSHLFLQKFAEKMSDLPLNVFFCIRRADDQIASHYVEVIKSGSMRQFEKHVGALDVTKPIWHELIGRYAQVQGPQQIYVWRYEDYRAIFPKLLDTMLGQGVGSQINPIKTRINSGLSGRALEETLERTKHLTGKHQERKKLAVEMRDEFPVSADNPPFDPWSEMQRSLASQAYEKDVELIAKLPKVTFITP